MEGNDNHSVSGEHPEVKKIPFHKSIHFRLMILGIVLILYDLVFMALYTKSSMDYSKNIREINDRQNEYQQRSQDVARSLRALNDYIDTNSPDELGKYTALSEKLGEFSEFLQKEGMGPYAYDLGEMVKKYRQTCSHIISTIDDMNDENSQLAWDESQENEIFSMYSETEEQERLITIYSDYTFQEIQEDASSRLEELYSEMKRHLYLLLVSFVGVTALVVGVVIVQIRDLLGPIRTLTDMIFRTSLGENAQQEMVTAPAVKRQDEMGVLMEAFYGMQNKIALQYEELIRRQKLEKQLLEEKEKTSRARAAVYRTRLQVFQSQINSHFLFNTFNIIGRLAYSEEAPQTREAALLAASFFRTVLNQFNRIVTVGEEFSRIEEYSGIQKLRFGDRIRVDLDCDPDMEDLRIPSMVLQPLVENAFTHGVAGKERGYIRCVAEADGRDGNVYVWDDGGTMTDQRREELRSKLKDLAGREEGEEEYIADGAKETEHIGLTNVFQRLYLMFGQGVEPLMESEEGVFTKIGFRFIDIFDDEGELHQTGERPCAENRF